MVEAFTMNIGTTTANAMTMTAMTGTAGMSAIAMTGIVSMAGTAMTMTAVIREIVTAMTEIANTKTIHAIEITIVDRTIEITTGIMTMITIAGNQRIQES
jgi:hypothetical protein